MYDHRIEEDGCYPSYAPMALVTSNAMARPLAERTARSDTVADASQSSADSIGHGITHFYKATHRPSLLRGNHLLSLQEATVSDDGCLALSTITPEIAAKLRDEGIELARLFDLKLRKMHHIPINERLAVSR